jgi:hypothetical protein
MYEDLEQKLALLVAGLSPEAYQILGPGYREAGLAIAALRQAQREERRLREDYERVREDYARVLEGYARVEEDLERAEERARNALRLLGDVL